mmetsp:Transcript_13637/g.29499  ORF Transcript_13637/g.29499 Transcript_13637/m.29499 type:complete len:1595 (+) Transcript_13637:323-5107(+)
MEHKRSSRGSRNPISKSSGYGGGGGGSEKEVVTNERSKYESSIRESQGRLTKYTAENDRLLDEVSNLRLQMREMKNDRTELIRAHHESMSLLAQVSEEKLVEFKSKSEQEAVESKAAQEEALRTVLEMMEKDCEDRVAEFDAELARVEAERERATALQIEAAARAEAETQNKGEVEEAAKLAVLKLVSERATRDAEVQTLEEREKQLKHELEMTRQRAESEKKAAQDAHAAAEAAQAMGLASSMNNGGARGMNGSFAPLETDGTSGGTGGSSDNDSSTGSGYSEPCSESPSDSSSQMSPLIDGRNSPEPPRRPPVVNRRSMQKHIESPFLGDPLYEMTRGRKIALKLQSFSWYRPSGPKHWDFEGLGLQSAWAYFEHSVLPRYIVKDADGTNSLLSLTADNDDQSSGKRTRVSVYESDGESTDAGESGVDDTKDGDASDVDDWLYQDKPSKKDKQSRRGGGGKKPNGFCRQKGDLSRAKAGETNFSTRLYSPFFTPLPQLGDFGIGVGLYFSSLRAVAFITLIAGCINLPNILYFASDEYSKQQPGVNIMLRGSAICTEHAWVPCPTCTPDQFNDAASRIAGATTVTPDGEMQTLVFAMKNACDGATFQVGLVNLASLGFILLAMVMLTLYQRQRQIAFDEQEQTTQDYSIEIWNPPNDATEPEEWKEFFESRFGGHMTCCTVTIDNDLLVKALAERREVLFDIEQKLKEGATINTLTLSELGAKIEHGRQFIGRFKSRVSPGIPELVGRLTVLNARIQGLAQQDYRATRVFCTFETEGAQRQVLTKMTVGSMAATRNKTHKINPNLLFRGEHVLHVREAEEPSTIRWLDLDESWTSKTKQILLTTLVSFGCIVGVTFLVISCREVSAAFAALAISISNALFPVVAKVLTNLEAHANETGKQSSLYVKIAIFRWVVTAIVITIITPFTSTITNGPEHLLQPIYIIFSTDLVITNVLQLADPGGNFKRHFLAPRAGSQERMNLLMSGTEYTVAERYTNMTKTLFLTFYYCAIYPSAFFLCSLTLFVNFYVDKYSLMRTWRPTPTLGPHIAKFSRAYFMTSAIAALAVASSYMFSGFPFDNLCAEDVSHSAYYGTWKVTDGEGQDSTAIIEPITRSYHFCNQYLGPGSNFAFPALPNAQPQGSSWMTGEQENLTFIYGWVSVGVLGLVVLTFLQRAFRNIQDVFSASYKPDGDVQGESFSEVEAISSYIPQVLSDHFTHPLIAVDIDHVDESIFDWTDPTRSHSYYDMTRDAEQLVKGSEDVCHNAFAQIRHWPPGGTDVEEGEKSTKSALRKSNDINKRGINVSWSSKVTCKTYSKDDPKNYAFFNANASTSNLNFNGHSDPLYDPHAQNEARVYKENPDDPPNNDVAPNNNFDPYAPTSNGNIQTNDDNQQAQQQNQPPLNNEHFDQYYNTGLDYPNQPPDPMYGESQNQDNGAYHEDPQNQDDGASWEGTSEGSSEGTSSYEQQSGSSGETGPYSHSTHSESSATGSYSSQSSSHHSDNPDSSHPEQNRNNDDTNNAGYADEDGSAGSSRHSSNTSGSSYSQDDHSDHDGQEEYYETEVYEDDEDWDEEGDDGQEMGSYSTGSSSASGLPPVT